MPLAASLMTTFLHLHQGLYERTDGRLGHHLIGVPSLILRTTGRRSGATRAAVLAYGRDGDGYVVVASNGGQDEPPAWLHNLRADPSVGIQVGRRRSPGQARIVEAGDPDYPRLWALVNRMNGGRYDGYQRLTARPIALVVLTERQAGA
ncbi:MAG TPA: nitroreductase family deazaflavin-dependent oxidoreductase [Candidatus Limnocylindrales bacterium]|nr:nitroreductase family deazaflavin-dependent oxidoreductase [Candidatus Limnocylindrales bacterium]